MKKTIKSLILLLNFIMVNGLVMATTTTPQTIVYEGELLDSTGTPLAGNYDFRFSFWTRTDYIATDVSAGVINASEPAYLGWNEIQSVNLDASGFFSFQVGSSSPWPIDLLDVTNLFFQVEVKTTGSPDSSFELLDVNPDDVTVDRTIIASVPHAFNADKLDFRELGFGAGDIPYLDETTGLFDPALIPFNINVNQVDGYDVGLNPGQIPFIDPDTGVISPTVIPSVPATSNGTDNITYTIDQDGNATPTDNLTLQFGSVLAQTLIFNQLSDQFEFSNDLQVNGNLIVTGTINGVTIGPKDEDVIFSGRSDSLILEKDGTDNSGSMFEELESVLGETKPILRWESQQTTLQDYDIVIRYVLPLNFDSFRSPAVSLDVKTVGSAADAKIDFSIEDPSSGVDLLSGVGNNQVSASWSTRNFTLPASLSAGDSILIRARMYARGAASAQIGDLKLRMVTN